ncbi:MAG: hypothetical protein LJE91_00385 [Gammaproteobacteria bacterium]|jgi:hypothetical protein|nr:hypothetical protein [Gammaproteobacteria bacterium]
MIVAHLVFALATTGDILIAIQIEERDLIGEHGRKYEDHRREVPMLIPGTRRKTLGTPRTACAKGMRGMIPSGVVPRNTRQ